MVTNGDVADIRPLVIGNTVVFTADRETNDITELWGGTSALLPVELMFFKGNVEKAHNLLYWQTASELNNKGFEVEQSSNAREWKNIGFVAGYNTTIEVQNYTFTDAFPLNGTNYYRLKQIDFDGASSYSDIIKLNNVDNRVGTLQVFPNPTTNRLNYQTNVEPVQSVQLFDMFGQLVKFATHIDGQLSLEDLNAGTYVLIVETDSDRLQQIVIKK